MKLLELIYTAMSFLPHPCPWPVFRVCPALGNLDEWPEQLVLEMNERKLVHCHENIDIHLPHCMCMYWLVLWPHQIDLGSFLDQDDVVGQNEGLHRRQ